MRGIFGGRIPPSLNRALSERSLADAHRAAGARRDVTRWTGFVGGPGHEPEFDSLTQILMEFDDAWIRWRNGHLTVVMRMLGTNAVGTAGCDSAYLLERVHQRFFQHLWEGRGQVAQGR
jgi:tryptophan 2,3-dioxygenase